MNRLFAIALVPFMGLTGVAMANVVYVENFDDGSAATRFTAPVVDAENGVFDGSVDFAYDYGILGIPASPGGGGTTTGVLFQANLTDTGGDQGEAVAIVPTGSGSTLPENYVYSVEAYFHAEFQSSGSTEFGLFGVHTSAFNAPADEGLNDDVPFDFGVSDGNGLAWQASGEAGASNDFNSYEDAGNSNTGTQTNLGSYDSLPAGSIPGVSTGAGATGPLDTWATFSITRIAGNVTFGINGVPINTINDAAGDYSGGGVLLGYADFFNSVGTPDLPVGPDPDPFDEFDDFGDEFPNLAHFVIYDNLTITEVVPEPSSLALMLAFGIGSVIRRRK